MEFNVNVLLYKIPDEVVQANERVVVAAVDDAVVVELLIVVVVEITVKFPLRFIPILRNLSETSAITCKVYVTTVFGSNPSTVN